jgi:catechol 2,3-dioxygenase-like lactoylglutathione lyase family enzyme
MPAVPLCWTSEAQLIRLDALNRARIRRLRRRDVSGSDARAAPGLVDRLTRMTPIQALDFIGIPSQDALRARSFYRDVLGMRPDEHAEYEQWAGSTCFVVWEPERVGMEFIAQTGNPLPLRAKDVHAARAELESKGVSFFGDTLDTGVCHMAIFADPDGNQLMLHRRYAPYGNA